MAGGGAGGMYAGALRGKSAAEAWLAARPTTAASSINEYFRIPGSPLIAPVPRAVRDVCVRMNALMRQKFEEYNTLV